MNITKIVSYEVFESGRYLAHLENDLRLHMSISFHPDYVISGNNAILLSLSYKQKKHTIEFGTISNQIFDEILVDVTMFDPVPLNRWIKENFNVNEMLKELGFVN